jgi:DNA-binding transcriptional ArsR family regulator
VVTGTAALPVVEGIMGHLFTVAAWWRCSGISRASQNLGPVALFAQFAAVAKSLAHAHRLELLEQLAQGERSVEVLAERTGLSVANASQHLQQMRRAGIVATRREGKFIFCTLADEAVLDLMSALCRIAEQNIAEVERVIRSYFNDRDSLQPVSREIVIRSCAVAMTPASACSVHKRRP